MLSSQQKRFTARTKACEPPARPLRRKKGCEQQPRVELLFDSFLECGLGGRSAAYAQRHLLYRAEPYQLDLLIEMHPERNRLIVTGQLLDASNTTTFRPGVKVGLSSGPRSVVSLMTTEFGEFWGEIENSDELAVSLKVDNREIVISIRDVLGQHPLAS
jgi:hypothetical protein